jgi:hypothetical protein
LKNTALKVTLLGTTAAFIATAAYLLALGSPTAKDFHLEQPPSRAPAMPLTVVEVRPEPVLTRGPAGSWDAVDLLNPSVIRRNGKLWNYYSAYKGPPCVLI